MDLSRTDTNCMEHYQERSAADACGLSVELIFPVIKVRQAVADSFCKAASMVSETSNLVAESASALDESCYEILSETTAFTSDDDARDDGLESLASFDIHTPDDISSLDDSDDFGDDDDGDDDRFEPGGGSLDNSAGSGFTARLEDGTQSDVGWSNSLASSTLGAVPSLLYRRAFEKPHMPDVLLGYGIDALAVSLRQFSALSLMDVPPLFRILYVGNTSLQTKSRVIGKIQSALAVSSDATHRTLRRKAAASFLNAIPARGLSKASGSPGHHRNGASDIRIIVDECHNAYEMHNEIDLVLNNQTIVGFQKRGRALFRKDDREKRYLPPTRPVCSFSINGWTC